MNTSPLMQFRSGKRLLRSLTASVLLLAAGQIAVVPAAYAAAPAPTVSDVSPGASPLAGGITITVTGTNFVSGATVALGGVACASPTVLSSTSITCTVPAHAAGAVSLVVTNPDSQTATWVWSFWYSSNPIWTGSNYYGTNSGWKVFLSPIRDTNVTVYGYNLQNCHHLYQMGGGWSGDIPVTPSADGTSATFTFNDWSGKTGIASGWALFDCDQPSAFFSMSSVAFPGWRNPDVSATSITPGGTVKVVYPKSSGFDAFFDVTSVKFDGVAVSSYTTVNSGELDFTVPAGVTNSNGNCIEVTNMAGPSQYCPASFTPIVSAPGTPGTPTATAGNQAATVTWTAPITGGTPTSYTVTAQPGGQTCTVNAPFPSPLSCIVLGLDNGTQYTFSVVASNAGGASGASSDSNPVTPAATTKVYVVPDSVSVNFGSTPLYTAKYWLDAAHTSAATGTEWTQAPTCSDANYPATHGSVGTYSNAISCSGGTAASGFTFDYSATATLTVNAATPTLSNISPGSGTYAPGASLTLGYSLDSLCTTTGEYAVVFSLDSNPTSGSAGSYVLTGPTVDTTGWMPGTYTLTVSYPGDGNCAAVSNSSTILTIQPNSSGSAFGGGWLTTSDGKQNFGFEVQPVTGASIYKGQVVWNLKTNWRFKGTLSSLRTVNGVTTATGSGNLWYFSKSAGNWVSASDGTVSVTVKFTSTTPSTKKSNGSPGSFAIGFTGTAASGVPALPAIGSLTPINGGNIRLIP